jgi:hypothetical protein
MTEFNIKISSNYHHQLTFLSLKFILNISDTDYVIQECTNKCHLAFILDLYKN